jgi:hypothetical protein
MCASEGVPGVPVRVLGGSGSGVGVGGALESLDGPEAALLRGLIVIFPAEDISSSSISRV